VFVTRKLPAAIPDDYEVWPEEAPPPYAELLARARDCDGLLCMLTDRIDRALIEAGPGFRVISQMAVGVDNIDLEAATRRRIPVGHTPGVLTETTADLAFGLLLATARRIPEAERFLREGRWHYWAPEILLGTDVQGTTLGIVGMGAIGRAVARRAAGFGMRVLYTNRSGAGYAGAQRVELDELLARSDFVSINCPLNDGTRGLIGRRELALMKPSAILVNASRGGIVDEPALVDALRSGRIAGAGLDVYAVEPLPMDSPLLDLSNVVLVPHIGSASVATRGRMAEMALENLRAGLAGRRLPNCANPAVYD
jgi:lactate dehydrogenase-like 2-hydroxyacid dehydrogenase